MSNGSSSIINYLISIAGISFGLVQITKKSATNPNFNLAGFSVKNLRIIAYIGIGIFVLLILLKF